MGSSPALLQIHCRPLGSSCPLSRLQCPPVTRGDWNPALSCLQLPLSRLWAKPSPCVLQSPSAQTHCCLPVQRINYKECHFPNSEPKAGAFCQLDDGAPSISFSPVLVAPHGTVLPQCPDPRARAIPGDSEWNQPSTGQGRAARGRHRRGQRDTSGRRAPKPREEESGPGPFRGPVFRPCLASPRS